MSFILDALRKSEAERQREATPTIARAPLAPTRRQVPVWSWGLIGLLSLTIVALGLAWWRSAERPPLSDQTVAIMPEPRPAATNPAPRQSSPDPAGAATTRSVPIAVPAGALPPEDSAVGPAAEPARASGATPAPASAPRSIGELSSIDPSLPTYRLDLLAYHADPARAYVLINGVRYETGDRVANGPTVAQIRGDGVVLLHHGETFLLRAR